MEFLLKLMRISHAILGITPAEPEDERRLLLLWIISLGLIIAFAVAVFVSFFLGSCAKSLFGSDPDNLQACDFENTPFPAILI